MIGNNRLRKIMSDNFGELSPVLIVYQDPQGNLMLSIRDMDGCDSDVIRLCGQGGFSRYQGLGPKLAEAFFGE